MPPGRSRTRPDPAFDPQREAARRTEELAHWAWTSSWPEVPGAVRERLSLVLFDTLAVTVAGARTEGQRRIRAAWPVPPGDAPVLGTTLRTQPDAAAYLNATALVCCELDEGCAYARGHPAAHAFPAILALAATLNSTGAATARALLAGYEVAARFGRATALAPGVHPHGTWGATGAAAGCALLLGLDAHQVAAAVDTAAGLAVAGHFDSALDGHRVRDAWVGAAALSGLAAARLAAAGAVRTTGTAALSLGTLLGRFDAAALVDGLGEDWQITHNYFKRHASCSYTHPAADLALDLRTARHLDRLRPAEVTDAVREIRVDTHALAAPLDRRRWDGSLGAMFSVPYAVAAALLDGAVTPATAEATEAERPELFALAAKVSVAEDPALTARLPHERATRLTAVLAGGERVELSAPHPVGDSSHHPFTTRTLQAVLTGLLGDDTLTDQLRRAADRLPDTDGAGPLLRGLAALTAAPAASRGGTR
ncbi:MmgE/PrpD family protein [Streptomyces thermoviolaceus]|uniref:MmgE/PrpD family protein n=1 Tax=Streptomyces thermoviolaceus subsp. thermoviolaceus TaxID=66860 RepID=A0ABX0YV60_STRTL|nr:MULTISPECIES: MmgE/PrpD family protein [Streptomyces]MCM3265593.1 MmgE/PrpD family protein [Streptomyces thermoviolaceus]NJP16527.1 MmgE/PrpD family protein [Streptomyces thermoviolaceus subsp. thermoviolaceus]RSS05536.1 2-methylcitrate dehydratase [Streptomyces sp. WAC00469]WTD46506.1 MmgE/PrpD family protein [Streptomyces thermoviolaceus]GGV82275.1 2-methylcitrate dehydratase [Streptomyces thermoviolaceus subsp. apingens]